MSRPSESLLSDLVSKTPKTVFRPQCFFVAWCGVITLAFEGFSAGLLTLKDQLHQHIPALTPEHPGSRWPHTTLGVLPDDALLSARQLRLLYAICRRFDDQIQLADVQFSVENLKLILLQGQNRYYSPSHSCG